MTRNGLRWGILGSANIARKVGPALAAGSGPIVAVASRDPARARTFAAELGASRAYGAYEALLEDPEVDAVYIPLPNSLHAEWSIKAAQAGKHILCEKPLAVTVAEAEAMIAAARSAGVVLMEAFMYRFHPQMPAIKSIVAAGEIGELRLVASSFSFTVERPEDVRLSAPLAGGSLRDVGCYCVNLSRYLAGAEPVAALAAAVFENGVDTLFAGTLQFPGNIVAQFDSGRRGPLRMAAEIVGTLGRIAVPEPWKPDFHRSVFTVESGAGRREVVVEEGGNWYERQAVAFAATVRGEIPLPISHADSLGNTQALVALEQAARQRRVVAPGEAAVAG